MVQRAPVRHDGQCGGNQHSRLDDGVGDVFGLVAESAGPIRVGVGQRLDQGSQRRRLVVGVQDS